MVSSGGVAENDAGLDLQQRRRSTASEKLVVTAVIASKLPGGGRDGSGLGNVEMPAQETWFGFLGSSTAANETRPYWVLSR